jgi:hypothetical protein
MPRSQIITTIILVVAMEPGILRKLSGSRQLPSDARDVAEREAYTMRLTLFAITIQRETTSQIITNYIKLMFCLHKNLFSKMDY